MASTATIHPGDTSATSDGPCPCCTDSGGDCDETTPGHVDITIVNPDAIATAAATINDPDGTAGGSVADTWLAPGGASGWTTTGNLAVVNGGVGAALGYGSPPGGAGGFFCGGPPAVNNLGHALPGCGAGNDTATATQTIDLTAQLTAGQLAAIDAGTAKVTFKASLGTYGPGPMQNDSPTVTLTSGGANLFTFSKGGNSNDWISPTGTRLLPAGTRSLTIAMAMTKDPTAPPEYYNDGYATGFRIILCFL